MEKVNDTGYLCNKLFEILPNTFYIINLSQKELDQQCIGLIYT